MVNIHYFSSSGEAYDATQWREDIANGDTIVCVSEGVVGIADTWPIAVTANPGELHSVGEGYTLESCLEGREAAVGIKSALVEARRLGFPTV